MTLNDLLARFKVIECLNAAKMTKYSLVMTPMPCRVVGGIIGSRALSFSDPYFHFTCLSVRHSVVLSVRNFGAKYLGNEAR